MSGLVRGACVSGGWSLSESARESMVNRLADTLLSTSFHWGKEIGEPRSRAKSVEARAYATAQVASTTTTGDRPHVEGVRIYTREAGKLVQALLREAGRVGCAPAAGEDGEETTLSLHSSDREFLTAERAEELLAPLLAPGAPFTKVKLSTKSFGRDAAAVAARAFTALGSQLKEVDLSDVLAGRPEAEALEALSTLCAALTEANGVALQALDLSDNALGEKGVRAAAAALAGQPRLRSLALQNDGISAHAAQALAELLASRGELKELRLYNNMTGCEGALKLAPLLHSCGGLEHLRIVSSRVGTQGGQALCGALAGLSGRSLVRLDLCDNGLGEECGAGLGAVVAHHPRLAQLLLNECGLCDSGVQQLCAGLVGHAGLLRLELCCNELTAAGARTLAAALRALPALAALRVAENELGDEGTLLLAQALAASPGDAQQQQQQQPLLELDFSTNELHGAAARALAAAAASRRCARLHLNDNALSAAAVAAVRRTLAQAGGELGSMEDNDEDGDEEADSEDQQEDAGPVDLDFSKARI